jgi:hypothetical protein
MKFYEVLVLLKMYGKEYRSSLSVSNNQLLKCIRQFCIRNPILLLNYPNHLYVFFLLYICIRNSFFTLYCFWAIPPHFFSIAQYNATLTVHTHTHPYEYTYVNVRKPYPYEHLVLVEDMLRPKSGLRGGLFFFPSPKRSGCGLEVLWKDLRNTWRCSHHL